MRGWNHEPNATTGNYSFIDAAQLMVQKSIYLACGGTNDVYIISGVNKRGTVFTLETTNVSEGLDNIARWMEG